MDGQTAIGAYELALPIAVILYSFEDCAAATAGKDYLNAHSPFSLNFARSADLV
jgi:hypothetical protein